MGGTFTAVKKNSAFFLEFKELFEILSIFVFLLTGYSMLFPSNVGLIVVRGLVDWVMHITIEQLLLSPVLPPPSLLKCFQVFFRLGKNEIFFKLAF